VNEDKATRYHRLRRRASAVALTLDAVLLCGLLATGASVFLRDVASALAGPRPPVVVLVYVLMLAALHEIVGLPFGLYRGFVLERRYGLSRETLAGWLRDHARASGVGLLFGGLAASVTYALLRAAPDRWWVIAAAIFSAATVLLAQLSPILLLPVFYRLTPLARPSLSDRLVALAGRAGSRVLGVYEWHLGDRTRRANAALVGIGRTRRILLSDTLLAEYSDDEIEAVLAHELGHHVHHDIWSAIGVETVLIFLGFFLADRALAGFGPRLHLAGPADVAGLPVLLLASGLVSVGLLPIANLVSRRHERRADRFALALTARPAAFASALRRLASQNLAEEQPPLIVRLLFSSHPPIRERIASASGAGAAATGT
jgi:STE24 endopeptidase